MQDYTAYILSVREQVFKHTESLDELSGIPRLRSLSFIERNAVERELQVVVEIAIGCAKHVLKAKGRQVPSEARTAVESIYELMPVSEPDIDQMRGAVGMRNVIVHDYLSIDWTLVESVLVGKQYHSVKLFIEQMLGVLETQV